MTQAINMDEDHKPFTEAPEQDTITQLQEELRQAANALIARYYEQQRLNLQSTSYHQLQDRVSRHMALLTHEVDTIVWRSRIGH